MLVKISNIEAINPFWVIDVEERNGYTIVFLGNPGGTHGLAEAKSDYSFEQTIEKINAGLIDRSK